MKKLAIFLGANVVEEKTLNPLIKRWNSPHFKPLEGKFLSGHELKFDSDWTWILAVVQKLHPLKKNYGSEHWLLVDMLFCDIFDGIGNNDIKRVCNDCIELLKYIEIHKIEL